MLQYTVYYLLYMQDKLVCLSGNVWKYIKFINLHFSNLYWNTLTLLYVSYQGCKIFRFSEKSENKILSVCVSWNLCNWEVAWFFTFLKSTQLLRAEILRGPRECSGREVAGVLAVKAALDWPEEEGKEGAPSVLAGRCSPHGCGTWERHSSPHHGFPSWLASYLAAHPFF